MVSGNLGGMSHIRPWSMASIVDVPHTKSHGPKGTYFGPKKYSDTFTLKAGEHLEDRMADEAVKFIHANKDRPFLLNYWAFSVHSPYFAKEELLEKYRAKAKGFPADAAQRNPIYAGMVGNLLIAM